MNISTINSASDAHRLFAQELNAEGSPKTEAQRQQQTARKQVDVAAKQFEAIIIRQLLSPAIEPLMSNSIAGEKGQAGGGGGVYGYLVTDVLANSLSSGGGIGLSKMLEKQLTPKGAVTAAQAAAVYRTEDETKHE